MKYTYLDYTNAFCNQDSFCRSVIGPDDQREFQHLHPHHELFCSLETREQKMILHGKKFYIDYPCIILYKPFLFHNNYLTESDIIKVTIFYFTEQWLNRFCPSVSLDRLFQDKNAAVFDIREHLPLFRTFVGLLDSFSMNSDGQAQIAMLMLEAIQEKKLENCCPVISGNRLDYIREILIDLVEHYDSKVSLSQYAQKYFVSTGKIYNDFKQYTGITFHKFITMLKLNEAKIMLKSGCSIDEIATKLGFSDPTYFFPFFKLHTGISPHKYIQNEKNGEREDP